MAPKDWIKRWLKEHPETNQTELAQKAGIAPSKLSMILNEKQGPTPIYLWPLSRVMNISLDSIYDPAARWPGKPLRAEGQGVWLTPAEEALLALARKVSKFDGDPEALESAHDRLLGLKTSRPEGDEQSGDFTRLGDPKPDKRKRRDGSAG